MKYKKQTTWELYAKTIRMRAAEKRAIRERIVSYMEYHPVRVSLREAVSAEQTPSQLLSEPFVTFRFSSWQFRSLSGVFALMLFIAVPAYAERALPGDVLYNMKVHVNEEVKASLTWQTSDKVAWQATRVERRIAEARLLAKEGKLTSAAEATLAATVKEHTESASREIATLRTTDAEGAVAAQATLSSTLDVQTALLATTASTSSSTASTSSVSTLVKAVADAKEGVGAHDTVLDASLSPEKLADILTSEEKRARALFETVKGSVSNEERIDIDRRLSDTERLMGDAKHLSETGLHDAALDSERSLFGDVQKLISFMSDIEVRASVSLETLVPKKLTQDESNADVSTHLEEARNKAIEFAKYEPTIVDAHIKTKFVSGEKELSGLIAALDKDRTDNKFDDAQQIIPKITALVADLQGLKTAPPPTTGKDSGKDTTLDGKSGSTTEAVVGTTTSQSAASTTAATTTTAAR